MAMFPLGSVLVPSMVLPLHVFEPRYRALVRDCLAGDREFGVVLIERGSEVGGGDSRLDVGTVARIVDAVEFEDGRSALVTVGVRRIRVGQWLADDPYPRADVEDWPDDPDDPAVLDAAVASAAGELRRLLALAAEAGEPVGPATFELDAEAPVACFQLVALAPLGPADKQQLLAVPSAADRAAMLASMLDETRQVLVQRLALDDDG